MRIKIFALYLLPFLISCGESKSNLIIQASNHSSSKKKIKILIDSNILLDQSIEVDNIVPSFIALKKHLLNKGKHFYKIECEDVKTVINDSFDLKEDSYLSFIFRNDLTRTVRKDSLTITFMTKNEFDKIEFW